MKPQQQQKHEREKIARTPTNTGFPLKEAKIIFHFCIQHVKTVRNVTRANTTGISTCKEKQRTEKQLLFRYTYMHSFMLFSIFVMFSLTGVHTHNFGLSLFHGFGLCLWRAYGMWCCVSSLANTICRHPIEPTNRCIRKGVHSVQFGRRVHADRHQTRSQHRERSWHCRR